MIKIDQRSLLTDALTPPAGCDFDSGVVTTFSLDLVTLLGLPLHLAWMGTAETKTGELDPLALLEALRRTAAKLTVFYQQGRIQVPRMASPLIGLLEAMVHDVTVPHGGVFHPKVWLLKFTPRAKDGETLIRLVVLSRNLTDDRSWDISLNLEGSVGRKPKAANKPLRSLFEGAMKHARKALGAHRQAELIQLLDDAMSCSWELPASFEEIRFHALGIGSRAKPWIPEPGEGQWDELGVVSPFVGSRAMERLCATTDKPLFIIARSEELDRLAEPLPGSFAKILTMGDQAESSDEEDDVPGRQRGLHAKVFVGKRGWNTHLFLGSANATDAALLAGKNIEFMAELIGKFSKVGRPGDWLGENGLGPTLTEYLRSPVQESEEEVSAVSQLEELRDRLAAAGLTLRCDQVESGWLLMMSGLSAIPLDKTEVWAWPVTQRRERAVSLQDRANADSVALGIVAIQDITSITGFALKIGSHELTFALDLKIIGMPADRDLEILRSALRNREGFVRYLLLLLGEWEPGAAGAGVLKWTHKALGSAEGDEIPVFELLARAFARDRERLGQVAQIVNCLRREEETGDEHIVPAEFFAIWRTFEQAIREEKQ